MKKKIIHNTLEGSSSFKGFCLDFETRHEKPL